MRTDQTFTAERLRVEAMGRRLNDPDVVGLIRRFDHYDILTDREARHWDMNVLPFGWYIVHQCKLPAEVQAEQEEAA